MFNEFNFFGKHVTNREISYTPLLAWHDGKVEHIIARTRKGTTSEYTIVGRVVLLLASAMGTDRKSVV